MRILLGEKNFSPEKCYCKGSNKHFQLSEWFQFWELQFQQPPGKQSVMHMYVNSLTWMHSKSKETFWVAESQLFLSAWNFLSEEKEHLILFPTAFCYLYCLPNWKLQYRCAKKDILWAYLKGELSNQGNNFILSGVRRAWLNRTPISLLSRAKDSKEKRLWPLKLQYINIHIFCVWLFVVCYRIICL